jgi:hypothetical protein
MSRSAAVLGCVLALTVGIQVAVAGQASSCIDHQLVDKLGQVVRDANGNPVPCGAWVDSNAGNPEWFAGDQGLYLGAGALLIGGGVAAAVATSSSSGNGAGGSSSQQNQLIYTLLLNNNRNSAGNLAGNPGGNPASP